MKPKPITTPVYFPSRFERGRFMPVPALETPTPTTEMETSRPCPCCDAMWTVESFVATCDDCRKDVPPCCARVLGEKILCDHCETAYATCEHCGSTTTTVAARSYFDECGALQEVEVCDRCWYRRRS